MTGRRRSFPRFAGLLLLTMAGPLPGADTALKTVYDFFRDLHTLQAGFHQEVIDSEGELQQVSDGRVWIMRPGKFRWDYATPYQQQIVADGERLWSYDPDLAQVTVQPLASLLGATPAMLLSGTEPLDQVFRLEALPAPAGELRVQLTPKSDDSNITGVQLDFVDQRLTRLVAQDSFGNTTSFEFTDLQRNVTLDDSLFRFVPPPGTDIVGATQPD
jgi:outer membrane lipoprotein carrier protein